VWNILSNTFPEEDTPEKEKSKLLVILGAGSSSALGLPSVKCLGCLMGQWGSKWAASGANADHFDELWQSVKTYYRRGGTALHPELNFEKVLGEMIALAHWMEPSPWGDTLRQAACDGAAPPRMNFRYQESESDAMAELAGDPDDSLQGECDATGEPGDEEVPPPVTWKGKYGAYIELMVEYSFLLERLAQHMRAESQWLNSANTPKKGKYRKLLGGLRERFNIGVYNLNYDTAAIDALPGAYAGFSETGTFEPRVIHERNEWDFVYHLHGSVHHSLNRRYVGDKIVWRRSLDGGFFDGPEGQWSSPRSNGVKLPRTTLVAGGFKLDQLLVEPFQSFHASLVRHVYAADAILICGYGFGDAHINFALHNRLSHSQDRPPVMVLDWVDGRVVTMRYRGDFWAKEFGQALCTGTGGHFFVDPGRPSSPIPTELPRDVFQVDPKDKHHVAVWQGGFIEAEHRVSGILEWLDGAPDAVLVPDSGR
jgi:hypothetical protein